MRATLTGMIIAGFMSQLQASPAQAIQPPAATHTAQPVTDTEARLSETIKPGDDFYLYVNQNWIESTQIPAGRSSLSQFNAVALETRDRVVEMIEALSQDTANQSPRTARISALYSSYLARDVIEQNGLQPIQADLDTILGLHSHEDIARWMANPSASAITGAYVWLDLEDTSRHLFTLDQQNTHQNVLGLPHRDYYLQDSERYQAIREAYPAYIAELLSLAGISNPHSRARDIFALETELAGVMWTNVQRRDRAANYHLMSPQELKAFAPGFDWDAYLEARGVPQAQVINVATDTAIQGAAEIFARTPVDVWRSYLAFHWIDIHAPYLPAAFDNARFAFRGGVISGLETREDIERRAINFATRHLGEEIGAEYVELYFHESSKVFMDDMVERLMSAYSNAITNADWLDDETRRHALEKLSEMAVEVGHPTHWKDYSSLQMSPDNPVENLKQLRALQWQQELSRLGGPYPEGAWFMSAHTVDAAFSPQLNAIYFPAGMLQPPFFDPAADAAVNFGAIGVIIGHEIGHGFDDQGSTFNADGHLDNWWSDDARENFQQQTQDLIEQFSDYEVMPGIMLNAPQMAGEILADLAGVEIAYRAYRTYVDEHQNGQAPVIHGLTGDQRFFIAYARAFQTVWTTEALEHAARNHYHPPGQWRANGILRNIDAWYAAFDIKPDQALYLAPQERAALWN